jgi:hypothetical protein
MNLIARRKNHGMIGPAPERSSAWLERVVWVHEVAGSNPVAPTTFNFEDLSGFADSLGALAQSLAKRKFSRIQRKAVQEDR